MECLGQQFYDSPSQKCLMCHDSCRSCSGPGQYSCLTCAYPLHFDRLNNQCVPCCPTDTLPEDQSCCHCDTDTGTFFFNPRTQSYRVCCERFQISWHDHKKPCTFRGVHKFFASRKKTHSKWSWTNVRHRLKNQKRILFYFRQRCSFYNGPNFGCRIDSSLHCTNIFSVYNKGM